MKQKMWIACFFIIICCAPVLGPVLAKNTEETNYENRLKAPKPEFTVSGIETYPAEYEAYYNDNLPYRDALIDIDSSLKYFLFASSSNSEVLVGRNNWLFFNNLMDDNCVECYKGMHLFTDEELARIKDNLCQAKAVLDGEDMEFILFIAPNKERIYWENMPDYLGEPAEQYRTKQLVEYLRENTDIPVVYPYEELMEVKERYGQKIYYRLDTHWNEIGGYVGSDALLRQLGLQLPQIEELTIETVPPTICDLADMVHLRDEINTDVDFVLSGYNAYNMVMDEHDVMGIYRYHCQGADDRKLFMVRDSFADAMDDYVGSRFNESCMVHYKTYTPDLLLQEDADIFVYETVERRVGSLLDFSLVGFQ